MATQHIETLVIGAGQAGLATGHELRRRGRPFLIVDGNSRIGDNWRQQWDSLRLYTPARYDGLPGLPFPGPPWSYPGKDEVADYLEAYAVHHDLPVRLSTRIERLSRGRRGGFEAEVGADTISCDNVVIATGTFGRAPSVPGFAADLDPSIQQLHSSEYRRPEQIAEGPVLVVGAAHSGCDIAYELAESRPTTLVGRDTGEVPFRLDRGAVRVALPLMILLWRHVLTRTTPMGRRAMEDIRRHGGPGVRVKREDLHRRGVERVLSRVVGVESGRPKLADGRVMDASTVIWCTGFWPAFDWIDLPILHDDGWPEEYRGVVQAEPGLYFCGLAFQYSQSSMVLAGVGRDAEYVAERIAATSAPTPAPV